MYLSKTPQARFSKSRALKFVGRMLMRRSLSAYTAVKNSLSQQFEVGRRNRRSPYLDVASSVSVLLFLRTRWANDKLFFGASTGQESDLSRCRTDFSSAQESKISSTRCNSTICDSIAYFYTLTVRGPSRFCRRPYFFKIHSKRIQGCAWVIECAWVI